ncbi:hypothetical protein NQ314_010523 [Rhamnusium bicolor]|uniref:Uncharacterized protein n=1 Tax=Rhamnusium bicolor TaxID=1586634 RepID=A0AAV8XPV1_9CUCU|nr:hypothetical protein NQ314_010523 [Rhamnusium bicolor]
MEYNILSRSKTKVANLRTCFRRELNAPKVTKSGQVQPRDINTSTLKNCYFCSHVSKIGQGKVI